jgi:membrane protease YdiL (CAAX protease family)
MFPTWRRFRVLAWLARWLHHFTLGQWRAIDRDSERDPPGTGYGRVLAVMLTVAIVLTLQEYLGDRSFFDRVWPADKHGGDPYWELKGFAWWAGWRCGGYVVLPIVTIALLGDRVRDYYLSPRGFLPHLPTYAILFAIVLPAVWLASRTTAFRETYPFYRMANRSLVDLVLWELMYAAQFLTLEFFFRGFILNGLRRAFGANAVFAMIVPYCMIHYGKPMPETLGALLAGSVLGTIAMRTRSIWGGVVIHIGVAWTMDTFALGGCPPFGSGHFCN